MLDFNHSGGLSWSRATDERIWSDQFVQRCGSNGRMSSCRSTVLLIYVSISGITKKRMIILGAIHDYWRNYDYVFYFAGISFLIGGFSSCLIPLLHNRGRGTPDQKEGKE